MIPAILSWSSGKDSAYTLYRVQQRLDYQVIGLVTTVTNDFKRVSMHGVREELLDQQAAAMRLPLHKIRIPHPCPNEIYEAKLGAFLLSQREEGVHHVIFGDLFLEDVRRYREQQLAALELEGVFPLWHEDTRRLAEEMIRAGFVATITCVDPKQLDGAFCGRRFDESFLTDLPAGVDPCGENGEFHSFVHDGPTFQKAISVQVGETTERDGFVFTDILP